MTKNDLEGGGVAVGGNHLGDCCEGLGHRAHDTIAGAELLVELLFCTKLLSV